MKIYNLVYRDMIGGCPHASAQPFASYNLAAEEMRKQYDETIENWNHDTSEDRDDYQCRIDAAEAGVMEGDTYSHWHIEEWEMEV